MAARKSAIVRYAAPQKPPIINIRGPAPLAKTRGRRAPSRRRGGGGGHQDDALEIAVVGYAYGHLVKSGTKLPSIGPLNGIETVAVAGWAMGKHKERGWMGAAVRTAIALAAYSKGSEGSAVQGVAGAAVGFDDED